MVSLSDHNWVAVLQWLIALRTIKSIAKNIKLLLPFFSLIMIFNHTYNHNLEIKNEFYDILFDGVLQKKII